MNTNNLKLYEKNQLNKQEKSISSVIIIYENVFKEHKIEINNNRFNYDDGYMSCNYGLNCTKYFYVNNNSDIRIKIDNKVIKIPSFFLNKYKFIVFNCNKETKRKYFYYMGVTNLVQPLNSEGTARGDIFTINQINKKIIDIISPEDYSGPRLTK